MKITMEQVLNLRKKHVAASDAWRRSNRAQAEEEYLDSVIAEVESLIDEITELMNAEHNAIHSGKKKSTAKLGEYQKMASILGGTHPSYGFHRFL